MASGQFLSILDVTNRQDKNGEQAPIAEMLSQCNDFMDDAVVMEASETGGHEFVFRTSIPAGSWASYNQGTPYSKSTTAKSRVSHGTLRDYSLVDRMLAEDSGNPAVFRHNEDLAFLEGMAQSWVQTAFYGNTAVTPAEYMGAAPFYNTVNTATAQNANNVIDCLGTGSSNTSMWLFDWGPRTVFMLYPRGSVAGLNMEDLGTSLPGYDSLGNPFPAYQTMFQQRGGFCPQDWRRVVRMANIDVTSAGLAGTNGADIFAILSQAVAMLPTSSRNVFGATRTDAPTDAQTGNRTVLYCNRTVRHWMDVQGMRNRNVLQTINDAAGRVQDTFRGIPVHLVDQLLNSETRVV